MHGYENVISTCSSLHWRKKGTRLEGAKTKLKETDEEDRGRERG